MVNYKWANDQFSMCDISGSEQITSSMKTKLIQRNAKKGN